MNTQTPPTTEAASLILDSAIDALERSRGLVLELIDGMSTEQLLRRTCDGHNHALWTLGHMITTDAFMAQLFGAEQTSAPESYFAQFGYKSQPTDRAEDYPGVEELRGVMKAVRAEMMAAVRAASPDSLFEPLPEDLRDFATNRAVLLSMMAMHEGMHAGQISVIRRQLGLAPVIG